MLLGKGPHEIARMLTIKVGKQPHPEAILDEHGPIEGDDGDQDSGDDEQYQALAGDVYEALKDQDKTNFVDSLVTLIKSCKSEY